MIPKTSVLLVAAAFTLLHVPCRAATTQSPGRIGVYARLNDESASPDKLREAMKLIKASGIDFVIPYGKGATVNWDSRIAPEELVTKRNYMERIVECAHAAELKVYPQFCVCTEGGESGPNAVLQRNPSWAYFYDGARRGYIDPGNAEARGYEVSLVSELVSKYDADGISLDYCHCPNHVGYTDTGRAEFLKNITIGVKTSHGALKDAAEVRKQMTMSRQCGADGLVFFTWESLRPFADELAGDIKAFGQPK
jgi:hypothetical protein